MGTTIRSELEDVGIIYDIYEDAYWLVKGTRRLLLPVRLTPLINGLMDSRDISDLPSHETAGLKVV
jgi:hypothetical protein